MKAEGYGEDDDDGEEDLEGESGTKEGAQEGMRGQQEGEKGTWGEGVEREEGVGESKEQTATTGDEGDQKK